MNKTLIYTDEEHGELPVGDALDVITDEWIAQGNCCNQTVIDLRNALNKFYSINCKRVIDHIEAICPDCGHTRTEDGCAYCIKSHQPKERTCEWVRNPMAGFDLENPHGNFYTEQERGEWNYCPDCGGKIVCKEEAK